MGFAAHFLKRGKHLICLPVLFIGLCRRIQCLPLAIPAGKPGAKLHERPCLLAVRRSIKRIVRVLCLGEQLLQPCAQRVISQAREHGFHLLDLRRIVPEVVFQLEQILRLYLIVSGEPCCCLCHWAVAEKGAV